MYSNNDTISTQDMIFDGEYSVIKAIKEKQQLIKAGLPHEHIRPLLIQGGGLMRGAYGVGAAIALAELGFTKVFTNLVGISSGAPILAHFAAGTAKEGLAVFIEDCTDPRFVNPWRFWNQVDTHRLMDIIQNHPQKRVDEQKVFQNPAQLYFGVAEYETALPKLINPDSKELFFKSMHASLNMQNVSSHKVIIDGVQYVDGGFSTPHVINEAIRVLSPTHVLVITNNDRDFAPLSRMERLLNRTIFRFGINGVLVKSINTRREARNRAIEEAFSSGIPTAVVWGDGSIGAMEKSADRIKTTVETSRRWWHDLFSLEK